MFKKMKAGREAQAEQIYAAVRQTMSGQLGEPVSGMTRGVHAAYERSGSGGIGLGSRVRSAAIHAVTNAVAGAKHVGGEPGSLALQLPRDEPHVYVALSDSAVSFWNYEYYAPGEVRLTLRVPREQVSVHPGDPTDSAQQLVRFAFTDGSFVDYKLMYHEMMSDFWNAVEAPSA